MAATTPITADEIERSVYGATRAEIRASYDHALATGLHSHEGLVVSLLSDAQEAMALGLTEPARRKINIVKLIVAEFGPSRAGSANQRCVCGEPGCPDE